LLRMLKKQKDRDPVPGDRERRRRETREM
jgi:hypothetical protein